jgi:carbon storage regulator
MLVLSRKVGETIRIGDDVIIRLTRVVGGRVSMGIEAPPQVRILRGELELHSKIGDARDEFEMAVSDAPFESPPAGR